MRHRILYPLLVVVLLGLVAWNHVTGYKSSSLYRCREASTLTFTHPYVPVVGDFMFVDSLEVYVGGWIERGTVTMTSDITDQPISFSAAGPTRIVSHSRMGEWYTPDFAVTLEPEPGSSCRIRFVYRFRGIF